MELLFQQLTGPKVRLPTSRNVDDLARTRIARRRLGPGLFHLEDAESTDLDPLGVHQALPHSLENRVDHVRSEIFLASGLLRDHQGELFFGSRTQAAPPNVNLIGAAAIRPIGPRNRSLS